MPLARRIAAIGLGVACLTCSSASSPDSPDTIDVLFIGNSLTRSNNLPGTTAGLVRAGGFTTSAVDASLPNFAIVDHAYGYSDALDVIASRTWDFVVLQQGPTYPGLCSDTLALGTALLDARIKAAGGQTLLLLPWSNIVDTQYFAGNSATYTNAAVSVGATLIGAGHAWRIALDSDASLMLYSDDGYHPGPLGTYLTALAVYERVTGRDARNLPPSDVVVDGQHFTISASTLRMLQSAAHQGNAMAGSGPAAVRRSNVIAPIIC